MPRKGLQFRSRRPKRFQFEKRLAVKTKHREGARYFALNINLEWRKSVEGIIGAGRWLLEAKEALPHGTFGEMVRTQLDFGISTANKLMAIASHRVISNSEFITKLPKSWGLLYRLTVLDIDDKRFKQLIAEEKINCEMRGKDVDELEKQLRNEGIYIYRDLSKALNLTIKFAGQFPDPEAIAQRMVDADHRVDERELAALPEWIEQLQQAMAAITRIWRRAEDAA